MKSNLILTIYNHDLDRVITCTKTVETDYIPFMGLLFNMNRLFSIFWLSFCVIIPAINFFSTKTKLFLKYVGMTISPLRVGGLFVINYIKLTCK